MPTFPLELILIASEPPSAKAMVSAAGKNIPVFVSPSFVMEGAAAVPSAALRICVPARSMVLLALLMKRGCLSG